MTCSQNNNKSLAWKGCLDVIGHVLPEARITSKCNEVSQDLVQPSTEALHRWRFLWGIHLSSSLFILPYFKRLFTVIFWHWTSPKYCWFFFWRLSFQMPHKCILFISCLWNLMAERSVDWPHVQLLRQEPKCLSPGLGLVAHPSFQIVLFRKWKGSTRTNFNVKVFQKEEIIIFLEKEKNKR